MRRAVLTPLVCLLLVVLGGSAAWGHASFREREVPAESDQTLVLRVPAERPGEATVAVETLVPDGFEVLDCPSEDGWNCEVERGDERVLLNWLREEGVDDAELTVEVRTPSEPRDYRWPTIQTYDSGTEAEWIGEAGEDHPAPVLTVGSPDAPVVEETGDPADHDDAPEDAVAPSEIPPTEPTATEFTPPVTATDTAAPTAPEASVSPVPADAGGEEGSGLPIITIVVVLAILAAAMGALRMIRRGPAGGEPGGATTDPYEPPGPQP